MEVPLRRSGLHRGPRRPGSTLRRGDHPLNAWGFGALLLAASAPGVAAEIIDIYCERTAPGLLDEPFNATSNLAFLAAAGWNARTLGRHPPWEAWLLVGLLTAIGVGSGLWHLYATRWALLTDVIPIALFIWTFLLTFCHRVLGFGPRGLVGGLLAYLLLSAALGQVVPPGALNGSGGYLPPGLTVAAMAGYLLWRHRPGAAAFAAAAGLFALSLTLRSLDQALCAVTGNIGSHFVWHLLNAAVLALLIRGLVTASRPA